MNAREAATVAARAAIGARHQRQCRAQLVSNRAHAAIDQHGNDSHANPICACGDFFDSAVRGASNAGRRTCRIGTSCLKTTCLGTSLQSTSRPGVIRPVLHRRRIALRHHHAQTSVACRRRCATRCLDTRSACMVRLSMIHTPRRASLWLSPDAPRLPVRQRAGHPHQTAHARLRRVVCGAALEPRQLRVTARAV